MSPNVTGGEVLFSVTIFTLVYAVLMAADVYLLRKYAMAGVADLELHGGGPLEASPARV